MLRSLSNFTMPKSMPTYIVLLCALLILPGICRALKRRALAKTVDFSENHYKIVAINSHLLMITYNESRLVIDPVDDINYKRCVIGKDSLRSLIVNDTIEAMVLGNQRQIVIWGVRYARIYDEFTVKAHFTMILVDPWICTYKSIALPSDYQPKRFLKIFSAARKPQVITYAASFDVFFAGPNVCSPCRFGENGQQIPLQRQVEADDWDSMKPSFIQALDANSASRGYFQIYHFSLNFSVVIKLLDSNFQTLEHVYLDQMVPMFSVKRDGDAIIGFCYILLDINQIAWPIICDRYDSQLKLVSSIHLPVHVRDFPPEFSMELDTLGRMLVTYDVSKDESTDELILFMYDANGQLIESINFGKAIGVENSLLINKRYCLVIVRNSYKSLQCINI